jgi:hypothetical protein
MTVDFQPPSAATSTDTGADTVEDVAAYLYSVLVSETGWDAPLLPHAGDGDVDAVVSTAPRLPTELTNAFRHLNILETSAEQPALVSHPIRVRQPVQGNTSVPHEPQFTQQNGHLWVMEPLDFTSRRSDGARDHVGLTAFMFDDLKESHGSNVETIAIYRGPDDPTPADSTALQYALAMIEKTKSPTIDWRDESARAAFLDERRSIALNLMDLPKE